MIILAKRRESLRTANVLFCVQDVLWSRHTRESRRQVKNGIETGKVYHATEIVWVWQELGYEARCDLRTVKRE